MGSSGSAVAGDPSAQRTGALRPKWRQSLPPGLRSILAESAAAARDEFRERLEADRGALERRFGRHAPLGDLAEVQEELSDRHHGGRTVFRVRFASGRQLAYKPRELDGEEQFHRLLAWLRRRGLEEVPRPLAVCNRGTHGWVEWVEPAPPTDRRSRARFQRRVGALLCVLELLAARDCHGHNVVACGAQPLLVDAETLLHRSVPGETPREPVLATGLTPYWKSGSHGVVEAGGTPGLADRRAVGWILEGYRQCFELLARHRQALRDGPLRALAGGRVRVLLRNTATYLETLVEGLESDQHRPEEAWRRILRRRLEGTLPDEVIEDEVRALRRLDVPRFTARANDTVLLLDSGEEISGFFPRTAFQELVSRLAEWDDPPLGERLELIRASYTLAGLVAASGVAAGTEDRSRLRRSNTM